VKNQEKLKHNTCFTVRIQFFYSTTNFLSLSKTSHISKHPVILSIAGFDPSSGAGITADVKTAEQTGSYALGVNTAITIQHESKFTAISWVDESIIIDQLNILSEKYNLDYIKIGLIENLSLIKTFHNLCPKAKIIWDPIIKASAGFSFHSMTSQKQLEEAANLCYLITPNLVEWEQIGAIIKGKTNILLKGGHANDHANDELMFEDGASLRLYGKRIEVTEKHGSGCVLSTAITSYLAQGYGLGDACQKAKQYITTFLKSTDGLLGIHKAHSSLQKAFSA